MQKTLGMVTTSIMEVVKKETGFTWNRFGS